MLHNIVQINQVKLFYMIQYLIRKVLYTIIPSNEQALHFLLSHLVPIRMIIYISDIESVIYLQPF